MVTLIALFLFHSVTISDSLNIDLEFSRIVKREIVQLEENVTLKQWREQHLKDSISFYRPSEFELSNDNWCICSQKLFRLSNGKTALRKAFFYIPVPSDSSPLPHLNDSLNIRYNTPMLGMIEVEMIELSTEKGIITANTLNSELSTVLGQGDKKIELWGYGSSGWRSTCRWQEGDKIFASAYGIVDEESDNHDPMVAAFGFLPISEFHIDDLDSYKELSIYGSSINADSILFDLSYQYLTIHQKDAKALLNLFRRNEGDTLNLKLTANIFSNWINLFKNANNHERAKAFIFADLVLKSLQWKYFGRYMWNLDRSFVLQLQSIGAQLVQGRTDGYVYERSWLKQAYSISQKDSVGDLALMIMLLHGFRLGADCNDCGQCFNQIIFEGERYLKHSNNKIFSNWVHNILGNAYSDSYYLSKGYPTISMEDNTYVKIEANYARVKAIEHFTQAFENKNQSGFNGEDWRLVWRLVADVHPKNLNYVCVDE